MQCACVILTSVTCPAVPNFPTLSYKPHDFFLKNFIEYKLCCHFVYKCLETFVILSRTERDIIIYIYIDLHVKYQIFLPNFNPLNAELNPICHLMALLETHHILHVSRIRVNKTWIFLDMLSKMLKCRT